MTAPATVREQIDPRRKLAELRRRRKAYPLAYARLWDAPEPSTSQRRAILASSPKIRLTFIRGGNRSGKSVAGAMWAVAMAAGRDACIIDLGGRRVYWVRIWMDANGIPEDYIPKGPGRVWIGSPTFATACETIRPHIKALCPTGTHAVRWDQSAEAKLILPNGGELISKAYKQFDQDRQSWEGANIRAAILDEQPNTYDNLLALLPRLVDQSGRALLLLTPLRGHADWVYQELIAKAPRWVRDVQVWGEHNPHIPEDVRREMIDSMPAWQREARNRGEFCDPEGSVYSISRHHHEVDPFPVPPEWRRWIGIDWGARHPHIIWIAESPEGMLYVYRELSPRRPVTQSSLPGQELIMLARQAEVGSPEARWNADGQPITPACEQVYMCCDNEDATLIGYCCANWRWVTKADKSAGSIRRGVDHVESLLSRFAADLTERTPRLRVMRGAAPVFLSEMEGLRWGPSSDGDQALPDPGCPDHGPDAARYALMFRRMMVGDG